MHHTLFMDFCFSWRKSAARPWFGILAFPKLTALNVNVVFGFFRQARSAMQPRAVWIRLAMDCLLMRRIRLFLSVVLMSLACTPSATGQLIGYKLLVDSVHYGMVGNTDFDGFITYTLAVEFEDPGDALLAVFALESEADDENPPNVNQNVPDFADIELNFDCELFNDVTFGAFGPTTNCFLWGTVPELEFDSRVTIGVDCGATGFEYTLITSVPNQATIENNFNTNQTLFIEDGTWFTLPTSPNALAGGDGLVEILTFTTCGGINGCFNVQWKSADQIGINGSTFTRICLDEPNPCTADPLDAEVTFLSDALCSGEQPEIQVGAAGAGNGTVNYELFADGAFVGSFPGQNVFNDLMPDTEYFVALTDSVGCRDTTDVFEFSIANPMTFTADFVQGVQCPEDSTAIISFELTGGAQPVDILINGTVVFDEDNDGLLENLACGNKVVSVEDFNGCVLSEVIDIPCPDGVTLVTASEGVLCADDCNATVSGTAFGGNGQVVLDIFATDAPGSSLASAGGNDQVEATASDLCPNSYVVYAVDANGCEAADTINIEAPAPLSLDIIETTNILCGGSCTGGVQVLTDGGSGDVSLTLNGTPVSETGLTALCASEGSDILCVVDSNNCSACQPLFITENTPIQINATVDNATCVGQFDGSVEYEASGGSGTLTTQFLPVGIDPNNLTGGTYVINVSDSLGCEMTEVVEVGFDVDSELAVVVVATPVSCLDGNDGMVEAEVTGGAEPLLIEWQDVNSSVGEVLEGLSPGEYFVQVSDAFGCTVSGSGTVFPDPDCIQIATAITPNGDGFNDTWQILGMEFHPTASVQVFNRWGQLVFSETGYRDPWDGTYNGLELPTADYYYLIDLNNGREAFTGTVTVKY